MAMLRQPERQSRAAARLGVHVRTIRRWRASGRVGWARVDGTLWVDRADLDDLQAAGYRARTVIPTPPASDREPTPISDAPTWRDDEYTRELYARVARTRVGGAKV